MSSEERSAVDTETRAVVSELEDLMAELRSCVDALQNVLTTDPEVNGDHAPA